MKTREVILEDMKELRICVLYGGNSSERDISLLSGQAVFDALSALGLNVILVDAKDAAFMGKLKQAKINFVFIALHGRFGEDGTLQAILERENIPYSGSSPDACKASMDKEISIRRFRAAGLSVPEGRVYRNSEMPDAAGWDFPVFVKPASSGSSIAVTRVRSADGLAAASALAYKEDAKIIVEKEVRGRELTVGILGSQALPPVEIIPAREFFDYEAKYGESGTRYEEPQDLSAETRAELARAALKAHAALGCAAFSRADLILTPAGEAVVLEINSIPGLTRKSLLPKMASKASIPFDQLCLRIIEESLKARQPETKRA